MIEKLPQFPSRAWIVATEYDYIEKINEIIEAINKLQSDLLPKGESR